MTTAYPGGFKLLVCMCFCKEVWRNWFRTNKLHSSKMAVGGCFCRKVRIEYKGELLVSGLCHCLDCRKLTGSPFSFSFIVKSENLHVSGNPKEVAKTADSGNDIRNYFCPDCGSPLYGRPINSDGEPGETTVVRAGIFDNMDLLSERTPNVEIYTDSRLKWIKPIEGALQFDGMMS